jgi:hypothetical protein
MEISRNKITRELKHEYSKVYQKLEDKIEDWWKNWNSKNGWVMVKDQNGISIKDPIVEVEIVVPKELNDTLSVGWQHRHYGYDKDPKKQLAEQLISILFENYALRNSLDDIEEDEIAQDLGLDNYDEQKFTPYSGMYMTGNGDPVYCYEGDTQDFTVCDSECGYCGRCQY